MARRLTTQPRRNVRHNNAWSGVVRAGFDTVAANTKTLLSSLVLSNQGIDETILRVVGSITVASDQVGAIEEQIGGVGLIVVTDLALAAGAASIPGPSTDVKDDGWFCHQLFANISSNTGDRQAVHFDFSSKGRRVVETGKSVALMVENASSSNGFVIAVQFRMLSRVTGT